LAEITQKVFLAFPYLGTTLELHKLENLLLYTTNLEKPTPLAEFLGYQSAKCHVFYSDFIVEL
jgi:hypothetical protein